MIAPLSRSCWEPPSISSWSRSSLVSAFSFQMFPVRVCWFRFQDLSTEVWLGHLQARYEGMVFPHCTWMHLDKKILVVPVCASARRTSRGSWKQYPGHLGFRSGILVIGVIGGWGCSHDISWHILTRSLDESCFATVSVASKAINSGRSRPSSQCRAAEVPWLSMAGDMQCFLFLKRKGIPVWVSVVCMSINQHRWYYCILWSWRARVSQCEKPHFCLTSWSTCWIKPIQLYNYSMFIAPGSWPIPSSNLKWLWTMAYLVQWYTVVYRIVWAWGFSWIFHSCHNGNYQRVPNYAPWGLRWPIWQGIGRDLADVVWSRMQNSWYHMAMWYLIHT